MKEEIIVFSRKTGGGVFFDTGSYWVHFVQSCIGLNPIELNGQSEFKGPNNVDLTFEVYMLFSNDIRTDFLCSFERPFEATHWLQFEKARFRIRNFFRAALGDHSIVIDIKDADTQEIKKIVFSPQNYYINQLNFLLKVFEGEGKNIPLSQSGDRVKIMEKIYQRALLKNR